MSDISENELKVYVDAVTRYFSHITREQAAVKSAYLSDQEVTPGCGDYTGLITFSGGFRGCVYFSAPAQLVRSLLHDMEERDLSEYNFLDAVGEIANTIAGNARRHFGENLEISTPVTIVGLPDRIQTNARARPFVILLSWKRYQASVVVDLQRVEVE